MYNVDKIRKDFSILRRRVNSRPLIYFDNAATTQKPNVIIARLQAEYAHSHANVHRGVYQIAEEVTQQFEEARQKIADFVGAGSPREIILTRNATEAINLVAYSLTSKLKRGDRILTVLSEHHSNFVPWLRLAERPGVTLDIVNLTPGRNFDYRDFKKKLSRKTKLVAVAHISNVSGFVYPVEKIVKAAHGVGSLVLVDGAQSVGHMPVNVQKIDCDFFAFSGHKMLAPSGIGVLYGKEEILNKLDPFLSGGEMIREVTVDKVSWNELPWKFEAGTPNIEGAILLGEAIDYLNKIGMKNIYKHEQSLLRYTLSRMKKLNFIDLLGMKGHIRRVGVIPFIIKGVHPHDAASLLDRYGIAVRAGHHCAQPFMRHLRVPATTRSSFYIYNTKKEVDYFIRALKEIYKQFS